METVGGSHQAARYSGSGGAGDFGSGGHGDLG